MSGPLTFTIDQTAYLDAQGNLLQPLPAAFEKPNVLADLLRQMLMARCFDTKAIELQRTGRLGTYASCLGQEAVGVGVGWAMQPEDVLLPSFRDHAGQLARGVRMAELFAYWGGDERGSDFAVPREDFPVSITVGGHAPHAAGVALAFKLRAEPRVAVCLFGDGATSKGDFYEAMNLAGVWGLPVVFVISNNQWAISTPRAEQSAATTLAQKAIAAGFQGEQVDGNDVIAVAQVVGEAIAHARSGKGPRLVECLTYRLGDHTTVDDASRYRSEEEVSRAWHEEPVRRLRSFLTMGGSWIQQTEDQWVQHCQAQVEQAVDDYLNLPPRGPESLFDCLFETLPTGLASEQRAVVARGSDDG